MQRYLASRVLALVPVLFGILAVVFLLIRLIPGDAVQLFLGTQVEMTPAQMMERLRGVAAHRPPRAAGHPHPPAALVSTGQPGAGDRRADCHPPGHRVGGGAQLDVRYSGADYRPAGALHPQLLARRNADSGVLTVPARPAGAVRAAEPEPTADPSQPLASGAGAGRGHRRNLDAAHTVVAAGSAGPGVHPHRTRQGPARPGGDAAPCPSQRDDPSHHGPGISDGVSARRHGGH